MHLTCFGLACLFPVHADEKDGGQKFHNRQEHFAVLLVRRNLIVRIQGGAGMDIVD